MGKEEGKARRREKGLGRRVRGVGVWRGFLVVVLLFFLSLSLSLSLSEKVKPTNEK